MREREERRELSRSVTPNLPTTSKSVTPTSPTLSLTHQLKIAAIEEQFVSDYSVYELPSLADHNKPSISCHLTSSDTQLINCYLFAHIEVLEVENAQLKTGKQQKVKSQFRLEDVQNDDKMFRFYTGFISFIVFLAFFEFLGPVVEKLNYWDSKEGERQRYRTRKLDSKNQLFLTLVKLRLN